MLRYGHTPSSCQETKKAIIIAMIAAASEIPSTQRTTPVV
jgi:hypothetical protein